jgi:hypothetical protein
VDGFLHFKISLIKNQIFHSILRNVGHELLTLSWLEWERTAGRHEHTKESGLLRQFHAKYETSQRVPYSLFNNPTRSTLNCLKAVHIYCVKLANNFSLDFDKNTSWPAKNYSFCPASLAKALAIL